jgi:two-component system chemotaxis response regulator CheB
VRRQLHRALGARAAAGSRSGHPRRGARRRWRQALAALDHASPLERAQVVLLDLEMPVMDGMTALPLILKREPRPIVIVASALTQRGAGATMAALRAGASDYIPKPDAAGGGLADPHFRASCWPR